jgi:hypothetical protein
MLWAFSRWHWIHQFFPSTILMIGVINLIFGNGSGGGKKKPAEPFT